jgi:hypothetical protein
VIPLVNKFNHIIGPAVLTEPRRTCKKTFSILESKLLDSMTPGYFYTARYFSKNTSTDISNVIEGLKRLYKKDLICAYWYMDVGCHNTDKYRIFSLKNSSEDFSKTLSETLLKQPRPSSSSSSSSESDSETEEEDTKSKIRIRKLSEGVYA